MHFGLVVMAHRDEIQVIVVFHKSNLLTDQSEEGEIVNLARPNCLLSIEIGMVTSAIGLSCDVHRPQAVSIL